MRTPDELAGLLVTEGSNPSVDFWRALETEAQAAKASTLDDGTRNRYWAVENLCQASIHFIEAFDHMKGGRHYEGWTQLERAEIALLRAADNPLLPSLEGLIHERAALVSLWQSLFPYKLFFSPGMRLKDWTCSICGKRSTPVSPCGHTVGRVYGGELCFRTITDAEFLEVSIVTDPVQKYSVCFPQGYEYDYSIVDFVLEHLAQPFAPWEGEWTYKRHDHAQFEEHAPHDPCPCSSGLRYSECCLLETGVRLPHFAMSIEGDQPYREHVRLVKIRPVSDEAPEVASDPAS